MTRRADSAAGALVCALLVSCLVAACSVVPQVSPGSNASPSLPAASGVPGRTLAGDIPTVDQRTESDSASIAIAEALSARAAAVLSGNEAAFLATVDRSRPASLSDARRMWKRIAVVPWAQWRYEIVDSGSASTSTEMRLITVVLHDRIEGVDSADSLAQESLQMVATNAGWKVRNESSVNAELPWEAGDLSIARAGEVVALGVGDVPQDELEEVAARERAAMSDVTALLGRRQVTGGPLVVVPEDTEMMARLLDRPESALQQVAAVTTTSAAENQSGADRVWLSRSVFDAQPPLGRMIVLRHESTHVVLRSASTSSTPLWLEEGIAEFVGYHGSGVRLSTAAADLFTDVNNGNLPSALPTSDAFDGANPHLARDYHAAWTLCLWLADRLGVDGLVAFYDQVASGPATDSEKNVDAALRSLSLSRSTLVQRWRTALSNWATEGHLRA
ncbi:MAG: hypothetical protein NTZ03_04840 [Actinobacteria bacterium]|nr:hypothetical protein [Actinomycetota bacterium]